MLVTLGINALFIVLNRSMLRVVIPEYIIGTALIIYNMKLEKEKHQFSAIWIVLIIIITSSYSASRYEFDYKLKDYKQYQKVIEYVNEHKENTYLATIPALQFRYLAYSPYQMPPKGSFSNLRVMGGWDMFTQNYYDFKEKNNLEGTFLDLLKDNVYLIDGDVYWSGNEYKNYINNVVLFIKEHYNKNVEYEKVEQIENIYIYKIVEK